MKWLVIAINAIAVCFALYVLQGAEGLSPVTDLEGAGVRRTGQYVMFVSLGKASLVLSAVAAVTAITFAMLQGRNVTHGDKHDDQGQL